MTFPLYIWGTSENPRPEMPDIKTRDIAKGTIKTIDKSAVAAERMKSAFIQTKEKAEHSVDVPESSAEEYASNRLESGIDRVSHEAVHQFDKQGRKGVQATKQNTADYEDFNDKEYIFGGTALERDKGSELTVTYELTVDSGTARLYWLDKGEEKMIADTSKNGTYSVTLDEGDNYLTLEGNDFCGSLQVVVE